VGSIFIPSGNVQYERLRNLNREFETAQSEKERLQAQCRLAKEKPDDEYTLCLALLREQAPG
jgi:hypothetical protein